MFSTGCIFASQPPAAAWGGLASRSCAVTDQLEPPEVPKAHSEALALLPFPAGTAELTSPSGRRGARGFPCCLREGLVWPHEESCPNYRTPCNSGLPLLQCCTLRYINRAERNFREDALRLHEPSGESSENDEMSPEHSKNMRIPQPISQTYLNAIGHL